MGKKMIVKGADFSQNGIIIGNLIFYNDYTEQNLKGNDIFTSAYTFYVTPGQLSEQNLLNKKVQYIKLYAETSGQITFGWYSGSGASLISSENFNVSAGMNIIKLQSEETITATNLPAVSGNGILRYWNYSLDENINKDNGWIMGRVNNATTYNSRIPISFGNIEIPEE